MQFGMFTFKAVYVNKIEIIGWYGLDFSLELISLFFQSMLFTESIPYFNFHQNCSNLLPPSKLPKTGFEPRILGFLVEEVTTHPTVPQPPAASSSTKVLHGESNMEKFLPGQESKFVTN